MKQNRDRILIVDDDPHLRTLLQRYLGSNGYAVAAVGDARAMDQYLQHNDVDLLILDLMLPGEDGLSIARRLCAAGRIPIIILSARGDDVDRIVGLELGADDYLPKPFNPRELLARIHAVQRRQAGVGQSRGKPDVGYDFGAFRLDPVSRTLTGPDGPITLARNEFRLLQLFVEHPHRVMSRDWLVDRLGGYERLPGDRSIDVRVARLRRKIEADPNAPVYIRTVWGEGYRFVPDPPAAHGSVAAVDRAD